MAQNIGDSPRDQDFFKIEEETDEEFGMPELRVHLADSLTPAVLKDWTAADFASIYVRFRPHLERHARKFLNNHSQVEEVVQEAFLYLMTTLPELDSELGVLKFLKWKTRLLALDVIRANSKVTLAPIDESPDLASNDPELSQDLERAEDAGIVALALSKIQPRHREAIIATLYEEKSADVVAAQMGLSENAFRQLLFRARSSFRKALVGEAETQGKSISEILSIAARKAAKESGKYISAAGAFLLVLAVSIGVLPNLSTSVQEEIISAPAPEELAIPAEEVPVVSGSNEPAESETAVISEEPSVEVAVTETESVAAIDEQTAVSRPESSEQLTEAPLDSGNAALAGNAELVDNSPFDPWLIDSLFEREMKAEFVSIPTATAESLGLYTVATDLGVWADFKFEAGETNPFTDVQLGFIAGQSQFFAPLEERDFYVVSEGALDTYHFVGVANEVLDVFGSSSKDSRISGEHFHLTVTVDNGPKAVTEIELTRFSKS